MLQRSSLPFLLIVLLSSSCATFSGQDEKPIERGPLYVNSCIIYAPGGSLVCAAPVNGDSIIPLKSAGGYVCYGPEDHEKILRALLLNE